MCVCVLFLTYLELVLKIKFINHIRLRIVYQILKNVFQKIYFKIATKHWKQNYFTETKFTENYFASWLTLREKNKGSTNLNEFLVT